ncbi:MAG: TIGR01777 family oxidoreductase [Myxococcota bacterium]
MVGEANHDRERRLAMVRHQLEARDITDPHVLRAMGQVPRHLFVPPDRSADAYADTPLPVGDGQTISQPYIVGLTLQLARAAPGKRALDVGTGSGYQAAVLARIVDQVYGLELREGLAQSAQDRLRHLGFTNVTIRCGDGYLGWPEAGPFDLIVGAAAASEVPEPLIDQLAPGGRLVMPVGDLWQHLWVVEREPGGGLRRWKAGEVRFVPMIRGPTSTPERHDLDGEEPLASGEGRRVVVSGASGLVGSALVPRLGSAGYRVERLVRPGSPDPGAGIRWDPQAGSLERERLEGASAVVHLAGASVAGRWTERRKASILESRVAGTRLLSEAIAELHAPPAVFVCASATGYYGDRGDEELVEESDPGAGFLARVCSEWERAAEAAAASGVRVVHLRLGLVLSRAGGALPRLIRLFRLGLGGPVGNGRQFVSWVLLDDVIRAVEHTLVCEDLTGPVNVVAPSPIRQRELARQLGRVLRRPAVVPVPAVAVKLGLGEMGQALLLDGARVVPQRLLSTGFEFLAPDIDTALHRLLATDQ